jgi:para-aminobenzoate synthetase component 1
MFKNQLLQLASQFSHFILLETANSLSENFIAGIGCQAELPAQAGLKDVDDFLKKHKGRYIFSHIGYDIKNELEDLKSDNKQVNHFSKMAFWVADAVVICKDGQLTFVFSEKTSPELKQLLQNLPPLSHLDEIKKPLDLMALTDKKTYLNNCEKILQHLQQGDVYELNFCIAYTAKGVLNTAKAYQNLMERTQAPMSCFYRNGANYLLCGSPERFIKKEGNRLLSQPIKGTIRRGKTDSNNYLPNEDEQLKTELQSSEKEQAENVMIVDLVRNDLSKIATKGSVAVDELFGIYSFKTVHQMISTVSCTLKPETTFSQLLKATFPMGSMTGAPKVRAMQLIEMYEDAKRGLFSGTVGYFTPDGDFDFNVVIRSIFYNADLEEVNVWAGSAITINSNPEKEYEECMLKLQAMKQVLSQ